MAQGFEIVPVNGANAIAITPLSQIQFSPSGKFLWLTCGITTADRNWLGIWDGDSFESVAGIPNLSSVAFSPDETRVLALDVPGTTLQLRPISAAGVVGNPVGTLAIASADAVWSLGNNLYCVIKRSGTPYRCDIIRVNGNVVTLVQSISFAGNRIWDADVSESTIYLTTHNTTDLGQVHKIVAAADGSTTISKLAGVPNGSLLRIAVNVQNTRFHKGSSTVDANRLGTVDPFAFTGGNFNGKTGKYSAYIFDDTVLQIILDDGKRLNLNAETLEIRSDITNLDISKVGDVIGSMKVFSRAPNGRFAWVRDKGSSTTVSPVTVIDEENPPVDANAAIVGLMGDLSVSADIQPFISAFAVGPMGDAVMSSDSRDADLFALAPMGNAVLKFQSYETRVEIIGIMATLDIQANNNLLVNGLAVAPMGDAFAFISKPGVCKSPR